MRITFRYIGTHWFLFLIIFGGICFAIAGGIGSNLGIPHLFRDDSVIRDIGFKAYKNSPAIWTQIAATFMIGIFWAFAILLENQTIEIKKLIRFIMLRSVPLATIPLCAAIYTPFAGIELLKPDRLEIIRMVFGSIVGLLFMLLFIHACHIITSLLRNRQVHTFISMFTVFVIGIVVIYPKLVPAVSIFLFLAVLCAIYFVIQIIPKPMRIGCILLLIFLMFMGNGVKYKYTFPGFEINEEVTYYDKYKLVKISGKDKNKCQEKNDNEKWEYLIDPLESLNHWREQFGNKKPKLAVVATSGGAYRSAFWTAIVFDALKEKDKVDKKLHGLINNIRLITGASGGMVGAAYFVASCSDKKSIKLVDRIREDTKEGQNLNTRLGTEIPIPRDSLSPVAQQLAQRDIYLIQSCPSSKTWIGVAFLNLNGNH